jgi:CDP-glucose 4,6-dehydratase
LQQLAVKWGGSAKWQVDGANHPHEASLLRLDVSKAAHRLAWRPELNLDAGLQLTVDWARANVDGQDMHVFTGAQISDYQARVVAS